MISVLFDVDGTLLDSLDAIAECWVKVGKRMGKQLDLNTVREFIGFSPRLHALKYFEKEDIVKEFLDNLRSELGKIWMDKVKPFPDAHETLSSLKDMGIKIGIVTSHYKRTVEHMLEHFGFLKFLDVLVSDEDVKSGKPAPDIVLEAMRILNISPHECFMVGDTLFDIESGKRAGAFAILIVRRPIRLSGDKYVPDYVISNLQDIITILKTHHLI